MTRRKYRRKRRRTAPSVSVVGYTRRLRLFGSSPASEATALFTSDVPDVLTPPAETVNRKLIRVSGEAFFACALTSGQNAVAQFCLWAHPKHESWPGVDEYDPFNDGPGKTGFEGLLAPRTFCRRTFVQTVPASGAAQTISQQHMIRSRAERLLRPGWVLSAGLYVRGTSGVAVEHLSLLRYVVSG